MILDNDYWQWYLEALRQGQGKIHPFGGPNSYPPDPANQNRLIKPVPTAQLDPGVLQRLTQYTYLGQSGNA